MHWRLILTVCTLASLTACSDSVNRPAAGTPAPALATASPTELRVLVVGGTSGIGLETVKLALGRGHRVTAMARRPERMTIRHENLQTIGGDILDAGAVESAMVRHDAVVTTTSLGPTRDPVSLFSAGTRNVLAAMGSVGAHRLIAVTGIGAGDSRGHGGFVYDRIFQPLALKTIYEDKDREEALIKASDTQWTIVRPGHLTDEPGEARYRIIGDLQGISSGTIARADVAHFIVAELESPRHLRAIVLLTN